MSTDMRVLALYDFRSKQEYIYRTNRMKEITGASDLIVDIYDKFLDLYKEPSIDHPIIKCSWEDGVGLDGVFDDATIGEVVYIGGGNLCILYRSREDYIACNKAFSKLVYDEAYGLDLLAACAPWGESFRETLNAAHMALDKKKRIGFAGAPCNALPFTQVDRRTFQPIVEKDVEALEGERELTRESAKKLDAYRLKKNRPAFETKFIDDIAADKGNDSLVAVMYFDGNSIGEKLKAVETVEEMREFAKEVHDALVVRTKELITNKLRQLEEKYQRYRIVIDHGDEITLICNAHAAPFALEAYFEALEGSGYEACAGMAICHSHDPFTAVYEIAEECCESGKSENRNSGDNASYIDFHFCRSGILGSLDQIRERQEGGMTNRPYKVGESYSVFLRIGELLRKSKIQRSDLKELNRAIGKGESWYHLEYERLKAKDSACMKDIEKLVDSEDELKHYLFDLTSFWDVYDERFKNPKSSVDNNGGGF